jgi:hypothetical protein
MAVSYTIVGQRPGIVTLGGALTQDVVIVGMTTVPHGTYMEFAVDQKAATPKAISSTAEGYGLVLEGVWSTEWVVGVTWVQQINPSNQLEPALIVSVVSASGNSTGNVTIPFARLSPEMYHPVIAAEHKRLTATEAL